MCVCEYVIHAVGHYATEADLDFVLGAIYKRDPNMHCRIYTHTIEMKAKIFTFRNFFL